MILEQVVWWTLPHNVNQPATSKHHLLYLFEVSHSSHGKCRYSIYNLDKAFFLGNLFSCTINVQKTTTLNEIYKFQLEEKSNDKAGNCCVVAMPWNLLHSAH